MNLKNIKKDRSGISTILIVIVVVIVLVVAAGAAYVLLSNNGDKEEKLNVASDEVAPGTFMEFDMFIDDELLGTFSLEYLGQNAEEYFTKIVMSFNLGVLGTVDMTTYSLSSKESGSPVVDPNLQLKKVSTINDFNTGFAGKKKVDKWEYTEKIGGKDYKGYLFIDAKDDVLYRMEIPMQTEGGVKTTVMVVKDFTLKTQKSDDYEESAVIGKTARFALSTDPSKIVEVRCVADCVGGKYGVVFDFTYVTGDFMKFFLCDTTDGKITGATRGPGDQWKYTSEVLGIPLFELNIYYKSTGVYKIVLIEGTTTYTFNLVTS
jgi:hypothetical protein